MDSPPTDDTVHSSSWTGFGITSANRSIQAIRSDRFRPETDRATKRALWILAATGIALMMSNRIAPTIDGNRVLLECPDLAIWGSIGAFSGIVARAAGLIRIPALIGKIAIGMSVVLAGMLVANVLLLTSFVQGSGYYSGSWLAQVTDANLSSAEFKYRNGTALHAGDADRHETFNVRVGQCVRIDEFEGRFGVRWVSFVPIASRPGGNQPAWAHCFADDPLQELESSDKAVHVDGIMQDLEDIIPAR